MNKWNENKTIDDELLPATIDANEELVLNGVSVENFEETEIDFLFNFKNKIESRIHISEGGYVVNTKEEDDE